MRKALVLASDASLPVPVAGTAGCIFVPTKSLYPFGWENKCHAISRLVYPRCGEQKSTRRPYSRPCA